MRHKIIILLLKFKLLSPINTHYWLFLLYFSQWEPLLFCLDHPAKNKFTSLSLLLLQNAFITKCFHYKMFLLQNAFITKCFHYKMFLLQNAFITKCFYYKMLLLQNAFIPKCFYSQMHLIKNVFTNATWMTTPFFYYWEQLTFLSRNFV